MTTNYVCENLTPAALNLLRQQLRERGYSSGLEDVFWLPVPEKFLTDLQKDHAAQCGPYVLALVLDESSLSLEFLVRASQMLHCSCIGQASPDLRLFAKNQLDAILSPIDA